MSAPAPATDMAEIMAEGLNKAQGVLQLASALHIDRGDVLAIEKL